jgi:hypothetical protein
MRRGTVKSVMCWTVVLAMMSVGRAVAADDGAIRGVVLDPLNAAVVVTAAATALPEAQIGAPLTV